MVGQAMYGASLLYSPINLPTFRVSPSISHTSLPTPLLVFLALSINRCN